MSAEKARICAAVESMDSSPPRVRPSASFSKADWTFWAAVSSLTAPQAVTPVASSAAQPAAVRATRVALRMAVMIVFSRRAAGVPR
ncbi:hypothetical protein [Peterkaempfera bronchialis]|uniref:hypothetical protein n=1 Tax=Peterkaempfera bronchialis TaxID=2126346 RepID=UPI0013B4691B|nr:hypothetical protein [Peterkaempfera bronchialis]